MSAAELKELKRLLWRALWWIVGVALAWLVFVILVARGKI